MLRVLTLATLFPNARRPTFGVFVERQTLALAARDGRRGRGGGAGRPAALAAVAPPALCAAARRCRPARAGTASTVHRPRYRVWPRLGAGGHGAAMAEALLPVLRDMRARFPFDVIDAEFFWPDGPAAMRAGAGARRALLGQGAGQRHPSLGPPRRRSRRRSSTAGKAAGRAARGQRGAEARHGRARHAGGEDPRPPYRHRPRRSSVRATAPRQGGARRRRAARRHRRPSHPAQGPASSRSRRWRGFPEATLLLVGDGPERARLEATGGATRPRRAGPLPRRAAARGAARAARRRRRDGAAAPAREGLANVWVEALACGTPVVTSDVGGAREVIDRPEARPARRRATRRRSPRRVRATARRPAGAGGGAARRRRRFSWERNAAELFATTCRGSRRRARAASGPRRSSGLRRAAGPRCGRRRGCPSPRAPMPALSSARDEGARREGEAAPVPSSRNSGGGSSASSGARSSTRQRGERPAGSQSTRALGGQQQRPS